MDVDCAIGSSRVNPRQISGFKTKTAYRPRAARIEQPTFEVRVFERGFCPKSRQDQFFGVEGMEAPDYLVVAADASLAEFDSRTPSLLFLDLVVRDIRYAISGDEFP